MGAKITLQGDNRTQRAINGAIAGLKRMGRTAIAVGTALRSMGGHAVRAMRSIAIGAGVAVAASALLVRQFMAAQKSEAMLADSLARTGDATQANIEKFKRLAATIQATTAVDGDAILEQIALAKNMGIATDQLELAARAAVGLAARYKIDLASAMKLISKANAGNTETLSRYGIQIDKSLSKQDQFNALLMIGAASFTFAEKEATTLSGRIQQVRNSFGDVLETLGGLITKIFRLEDRFGSLAKVFDSINERLGNVNVEKWADRATEAIEKVKDAAGTLGGILGGLGDKTQRTAALKDIGSIFAGIAQDFGGVVGNAMVEAGVIVSRLLEDRFRKMLGMDPVERVERVQRADGGFDERRGIGVAIDKVFATNNLETALSRAAVKLGSVPSNKREKFRGDRRAMGDDDRGRTLRAKQKREADAATQAQKQRNRNELAGIAGETFSAIMRRGDRLEAERKAKIPKKGSNIAGDSDFVPSMLLRQESERAEAPQRSRMRGNAARLRRTMRFDEESRLEDRGLPSGRLARNMRFGDLTKLEDPAKLAAQAQKDSIRKAGFALRGLPEIPKGGMIGLTSEMGTKNNPMYVAQTDEVI